MLVYRDQRSLADPRRMLSNLRSLANRFCTSGPPHDVARDMLIEVGSLEGAVLDTVFPDQDGTNPITQRLRGVSLASGHLLWHTWHANVPGSREWCARIAGCLEEIPEQWLPHEVEITVPEGYAHYAVYPEMYLEAARQCHSQLGRIDAVCLGLRSIGTSLSAAVAAALEELGCAVESVTLRPRGHPFSRHPSLDPELTTLLRNRSRAHYLLVDEGPGISGSSFAGTAAMLREWGIAEDRILLFPSWRTDGTQLKSPVARQHWSSHPQFNVSFEELWLRSNKFGESFPGNLEDVSAGRWRAQVFDDETEYPAVQPQHERRKYLLTPTAFRGAKKILRFAGLGEHGISKVCRAHELAEAGFQAKPEMLAHGFLLQQFVPGVPAAQGRAEEGLLDTAARYLAHLSLEHRTEPTVSNSSLREMIAVNTAEGLGDRSSEKLLDSLPPAEWAECIVSLDGRMLPQEWIRTRSGYLKTDAIDHHDDHFFPGCQDIAWDIAAAAVELGVDQDGREHLVERYRVLSGDRTIARRLYPYTVAYLAFRLGYTTLAASVLGDSPDGLRFSNEALRYRCLLEDRLRHGVRSGPHG